MNCAFFVHSDSLYWRLTNQFIENLRFLHSATNWLCWLLFNSRSASIRNAFRLFHFFCKINFHTDGQRKVWCVIIVAFYSNRELNGCSASKESYQKCSTLHTSPNRISQANANIIQIHWSSLVRLKMTRYIRQYKLWLAIIMERNFLWIFTFVYISLFSSLK